MRPEYIKGNELLTIPEALNDVTSRIIALSTTDKKTRKSNIMVEALKSLIIAPKILAKWSNSMRNVLLATMKMKETY